MRVLITGANGFLGSLLAEAFVARGDHVIGTFRNLEKVKQTSVISALHWEVGTSPIMTDLGPLDLIIHTAWDFRTIGRANVHASQMWAKVAVEHRCGAVFISSYSAWNDFPTRYGRDKAAAEQIFLALGHTVIRPALIAGPGGLFLRLASLVARSSYLPLPGGGRPEVDIVDQQDLVSAIVNASYQRIPGALNASGGRIPFSVMARIIASHFREMEPFIVHIPSALCVLGARLARAFNLGVTQSDNILGYLANARRDRLSHLEAILGHPPITPPQAVQSIAEMLARARSPTSKGIID